LSFKLWKRYSVSYERIPSKQHALLLAFRIEILCYAPQGCGHIIGTASANCICFGRNDPSKTGHSCLARLAQRYERRDASFLQSMGGESTRRNSILTRKRLQLGELRNAPTVDFLTSFALSSEVPAMSLVPRPESDDASLIWMSCCRATGQRL
jgi:hypothetical protein